MKLADTHLQLNQDLASALCYSLALDESADISDVVQLRVSDAPCGALVDLQ